ncbi:Triple functional domain protein [Cytospora mali]|uniref:Triple functional domain protein n=1 Tax=Cytospora mali TaxID=578113 RepID=A0A194VSR0_CYTMA|nr:Triple functional domain protein [Valsa mali]
MAGMNNGYSMGPRVPLRRRLAMESEQDKVTRAWSFMPSRVVGRSSSGTDSSCSDSTSSNTCEKPTNMNVTSEITIGVLIPVLVVFVCVLFYFHRRNVKRQAAEDAIEAHKSLDFGVETGNVGGKKRQSKLGFGGEKSKKTRGLSLDMNLSSPYLLPETVQGSRESMHSLAKTLHQQDDPYRPVANYINDTGSIRSFEKTGRYTPSTITTSTKRMSRTSYAYPKSPGYNGPPPLRQNSYPKSPLTPSASSSLTAVESTSSEVTPPPATVKEQTVPEHEPLPHHNEAPAIPEIPEIQQPAPVAQRGVPLPPTVQEPEEELNMPQFSNGSNESVDETGMVSNTITNASSGIGLGLLNGPQVSEVASSPTTQKVNIGPAHQSVSAVIVDTDDYADYLAATESDDEGRGRGRVRESGLLLPTQNSNRLSVGFRPLPEEGVEGEDPETRANRIRSFYKEYFDDSKDANRQTQFLGGGGAAGAGAGAGNYGVAHGGGDANYMGDAAYFDPDSNQFIMPYAQPVSRRAMTPPPSGSRFPGPRGPGPRGPGPMGPRGPGPRGPGRGHAGSISGMSMPRAGSAMSFGPRPDSSASARAPRSGSAMSGKPRKPMPPPAPLPTLPTPGKLTDDHFSLINAADFAPPAPIQDRAAGRSQSPLGERRAYAPKLPAASPLMSTNDEMAALPSPHMMRKSSTFTGLDFAPPRKFKDPENMSDAGSIRSNRSGVSQAASYAMRSGAGRVSRLPEDAVFTQASAVDSLKPTWTIGGVDTKKGP